MWGEIHVWMPMIGFDRDEPDKGVGRVLERMSFTPKGISAFLFHPDIVNQHPGMSHERVLPPDNCSYYGSPRNEERYRQEWTNYDLRILVENLNASGVEPYLGIMGVDLGNRWHREWIGDHPELRFASRDFVWGYNVLKRLADGTYYEDYFVDKLCEVLTDYGFAGLQAADNFCPAPATLSHGDFSADMFLQFIEYTRLNIPAELEAGLQDERQAARQARGDWLWNRHREEWILFHAWRWEGFWRKICDRLHRIGKKAIVLGMYCTDPFETLYCKGVDLQRLAQAGVDYLMPNIVPTGLRLQLPDRPDRFHRYMTLAPLTAAFVPDGALLSLLGVKDATEEWDVLHHAPCLLERDITTLLTAMIDTGKGLQRCLDGLMICLGDGIRREEWDWLRERFTIAFAEGVRKILAPTLIWSDAALYNTLPAYIRDRRWTLHKFVYDLAERGVWCGAIMRIEHLSAARGPVFVPNFDLLPVEEQRAVAAYRHGALVGTAAATDFDPATHGLEPELLIVDRFSTNPMCFFACRTNLDNQEAIMTLADKDDGSENLEGDPADAPEYANTLHETLTFSKVTAGFRDALACLLHSLGNDLFTCNLPILPMLMADGHYRLTIWNPDKNSYGYATVTTRFPIDSVANVSSYPVLPVKFMESPEEAVGWIGKEPAGEKHTFLAKVSPGGVTILAITPHP